MQQPGSPFAHSSSADSFTTAPSPLPDGWWQHRRSVRRRGPWRALLVPALAGVAASAALWGSTVWWRGLVGLVLAVAAAPLLPLTGVPATTEGPRLLIGVAASAVAWWGLGWLAARRATRIPGATWPEWTREFLRLACGFVVGGWAALGLAAVVVALRAG